MKAVLCHDTFVSNQKTQINPENEEKKEKRCEISLEETAKTQQQPHAQVGSQRVSEGDCRQTMLTRTQQLPDTHSASGLRSLNELVSMQAGKNID